MNIGVRWEPYNGYISEDGHDAVLAGPAVDAVPEAPAGLLFAGDQGVPQTWWGAVGIILVRVSGLALGRLRDRQDFYPHWRREVLRADDARDQPDRFTLIQPFTTDITVVSGDAYNIFANAPFNGVSPFPRPSGADLKSLRLFHGERNHLEPAVQNAERLPVELVAAAGAGREHGVGSQLYCSSSVNLFSTVESNFAQYIPGQSTIANTQARRLYPQFGQINNTLSAF